MSPMRAPEKRLAPTPADSRFELVSDFQPKGDQPTALAELTEGLRRGDQHQVLLGVTGSGKTFTMAHVLAQVNRPALVLAHNKTLAAQLYQEFRAFFPDNAVEYFVSYYDYYQPEAYVPQSDTYIDKEAIDQRRDRPHAAVARRAVAVRAARRHHRGLGLLHLRPRLARGLLRDAAVRASRASRSTASRSCSQARGDPVRAQRLRLRARHLPRARRRRSRSSPPTRRRAIRIELFGDEVTSDRVLRSAHAARPSARLAQVAIYPSDHYVTPRAEAAGRRSRRIEAELDRATRRSSKRQGKLLEAQRLYQRTMFDLEMLREVGLLPRHRELLAAPLRPRAGRAAADAARLLAQGLADVIDETHQTRPAGARRCTTATASARRRWSSTASGCRRPSTTGR